MFNISSISTIPQLPGSDEFEGVLNEVLNESISERIVSLLIFLLQFNFFVLLEYVYF